MSTAAKCLVLLAVLGAIARADGTVAQAKRLFDAGYAHYVAGRYEEALRAYQAGYELVPNPKFLLNLGQTYRKLGRLDEARASLLKYLDTLGRDDPRRVEVAQVLAEIDLKLQHTSAPEKKTPE